MNQINPPNSHSLLSVVGRGLQDKQRGDRPLYALLETILDGEVLSWDL